MAASAVAAPVPLQLRIHTLRRTGVVSRRCRMPVRLFRRCRQISSGPGAAVRLNRPFGIPNGTGPPRPALCNCHCIGHESGLFFIYTDCTVFAMFTLSCAFFAQLSWCCFWNHALIHCLRPNETPCLDLFCSPVLALTPASCTCPADRCI